MNVVEATESYERWLRTQLSVVLDDDLALKHQRMATSPFEFLRATYYRWLQRLEQKAPAELRQAPVIAVVGDLHVENFGCWRDGAGRLVWGANDFDEPARLPYVFDLLRLCASALVAIRVERLPLHEREACDAMLGGYRESLSEGGRPFVVDDHHWLATATAHKAPAVPVFWKKLGELPPDERSLPQPALDLLRASAPDGGWDATLRRRTAGLGSLGHRRVVAIGDAHGACELKELAPPASAWLGLDSEAVALPEPGPSWQPDPSMRTSGGWRCRRYAPDTIRLELTDYGRGGERRLLHAMGFETANVHQRAQPEEVARVRDHAAALTVGTLRTAAADLADMVEHDWRSYRASSGTRP